MKLADAVRPKIRAWVRRLPGLGQLLTRLPLAGGARDSSAYWEQRYAAGGDSGHGSRGALAEFKAGVLNDLVVEQGLTRVLELGCGDGAQLELARYPSYVGLDIAPSAVDRCRRRFAGDPAKSFAVYEPDRFDASLARFRCDLALSLDVVYHLVEDRLFALHMEHLFSTSERFVALYSSNHERPVSAHVRHRHFTAWVEREQPGWTLVETRPNPLAMSRVGGRGSDAEFFVYLREDAA